ncbi:MAG: adenylosuccinate synthase [candidate division KSB1 bacterium]|nr:adenylosuccinate synthase [candidate division KSB1 bacterium]MDZ7274846.1 adenylosuccinate synthase [candidate division KSB1 bacterium]MDZ7288213.1 adenylosuccinate synthase [candidate division KSB1 bacterium]MDZ7300406.1 adenylosuccinate synthase [candidate division KSB1 bacterium]MDZ7308781.1 adenylosuccinate synthase [candidate division KSB1 bacterium]
MPVQVVIGAQWGDEGKGKIIDLLSESAAVVARYQGGANAGHTVVHRGEKFVLHLIPSGILHPHIKCVLGNGMVIDPVAFLAEVSLLEQRGLSLAGRLFISHRAHLVMPYHKLLDQSRETASELEPIGTTGRGIGPAYVDKALRMGIRVVDLLDAGLLRRKIEQNLQEKNALLSTLYGHPPLDPDDILREYQHFDALLDPYITDTARLLQQSLAAGQRILCEGAQGTLLDLDFGTYPFVTSSSPTAGGACTGLGIGPTTIDEVLGVVKAYTTRVGRGPLPTEIPDDSGIDLRRLGAEFGATTGRPRRCGWFDAVVANYAVHINGLAAWAVTKLDVLDTLSEIKVCVAYRHRGRELRHFPADLQVLENCEPVYETLPGWCTPTGGARTFKELPARAQDYLRHLENLTKTPVRIVSVGAEREQILWR